MDSRRSARVYISSRKADGCAAAAQELKEYGTVTAIPADLSTASRAAAGVTGAVIPVDGGLGTTV